MKKLCLLMVLCAVALLCVSAQAITIQIKGSSLFEGTPLDSAISGPMGDFENLGVAPLVQLFNDGDLIKQTTVGAGVYVAPVNGKWSTTVSWDLAVGDVVTVRAFVNPTATGPFAEATQTIESGQYVYDVGCLEITDVGTPSVPEPSVLMAGLALLFLRRK